jgi:DNA-binding transcriptional ArsR family regulator
MRDQRIDHDDDTPRAGQAEPVPEPGPGQGDDAGERPPSLELRDARSLRALAHPTRLKLVGLLRLEGPMTATQAARELGETPQRCTFHLGQLAKHGLVEEAGGGHGRERPWRATASSTSWPNVASGPEAAVAAQMLEAVVVEQHFESVMAYIDGKDEIPEEWQEAAQLNDAALYLTAEELAELGRQVWDLLEPYAGRLEDPAQRPEGARPVTFLNLAFPRLQRGAAGQAGAAGEAQPTDEPTDEAGPSDEPADELEPAGD